MKNNFEIITGVMLYLVTIALIFLFVFVACVLHGVRQELQEKRCLNEC